nr:fasciclin-1-like [Onthophagus taurus]
MEQILHKIDEVLVPVVTRTIGQTDLYSPNAWEFIDNYESWMNIKNHRIRLFKEQILFHKKQEIFKTEGGHTFFIPVDDGFKNTKAVDAKVIDGHVIPKQVLFTSPTEKGENFQTLANSDNIKVHVAFSEETEGKSTMIYIKSHTLYGDKKGVVIAAIKQANIPVRNGVVHLIHKPLMVVDQTVKQFLELNKEKEDGPLSKFCQEIFHSEVLGKEFMNVIERSKQITLFAPTNAAWDESNLQNLLKEGSKIKDVLTMHLIPDEAVYIDRIANKEVVQKGTYNSKKNLFFSVNQNNHNRTFMVEGGGVMANIVQPDIAASNGVIHVIDRVLGFPYTTIFDKLKYDSTLNDTYVLGARTRVNELLNDTSRKFTYFVPSAKAWNQARLDLPSAIKKVFMHEYIYQAEQILERHLVVDEESYTMQKLKLMGNQTKGVDLKTIRDNITISVEEQNNNSFIIHWQGKKIQVFRPNIECTNGIIHVIDYPFIDKGDIVVSSISPLSITPHLLTLIVAKYLLL